MYPNPSVHGKQIMSLRVLRAYTGVHIDMTDKDDLSMLAPDVREAWNRTRYASGLTKGSVLAPVADMETIFGDHTRLAQENADFRRAFADLSAKHLAVERELATLRDAPVFTCDAEVISGRDGDYISMVLKHADPTFQYPDMDDKRVRLVVEDDHA